MVSVGVKHHAYLLTYLNSWLNIRGTVAADGCSCTLSGKSIGVDCSGPECGDHMTCTGSDVTHCACSEGYEENTFKRCGSAVDGTCSGVEHCGIDMECSENNTCVCRHPLIVKADRFCGTCYWLHCVIGFTVLLTSPCYWLHCVSGLAFLWVWVCWWG